MKVSHNGEMEESCAICEGKKTIFDFLFYHKYGVPTYTKCPVCKGTGRQEKNQEIRIIFLVKNDSL